MRTPGPEQDGDAEGGIDGEVAPCWEQGLCLGRGRRREGLCARWTGRAETDEAV